VHQVGDQTRSKSEVLKFGGLDMFQVGVVWPMTLPNLVQGWRNTLTVYLLPSSLESWLLE